MSAGLHADRLYAEAHLGFLFGGCRDGFMIVSHPVPNDQGKDWWRSASFHVGDIEKAARWCADKSDTGFNVFTRMTLLAEPIPAHKRGTTDLTAWATCVWSDIDFAAPGHALPEGRLRLPPTV